MADAVGWVVWPVKAAPEMTYNVSSGTLTHWLTHTWVGLCYMMEWVSLCLPGVGFLRMCYFITWLHLLVWVKSYCSSAKTRLWNEFQLGCQTSLARVHDAAMTRHTVVRGWKPVHPATLPCAASLPLCFVGNCLRRLSVAAVFVGWTGRQPSILSTLSLRGCIGRCNECRHSCLVMAPCFEAATRIFCLLV